MKISFSVVDFFAYLSSGLMVVASIDLVFGNASLLENDIWVALGVFGIIAAYVTGHLVAQISSQVRVTLIKSALKGVAALPQLPFNWVRYRLRGKAWKASSLMQRPAYFIRSVQEAVIP